MNELDPQDVKNLEPKLIGSVNNEETLAKTAITKEADRHLVEIMERVNTDFQAGRVSKQDLISWIIIDFAKDAGDPEISAIRDAHFDELAYFDNLYKRVKKTGVVPPEFKRVMLSCMAADPAKSIKTRSSKKKGEDNG